MIWYVLISLVYVENGPYYEPGTVYDTGIVAAAQSEATCNQVRRNYFENFQGNDLNGDAQYVGACVSLPESVAETRGLTVQ